MADQLKKAASDEPVDENSSKVETSKVVRTRGELYKPRKRSHGEERGTLPDRRQKDIREIFTEWDEKRGESIIGKRIPGNDRRKKERRSESERRVKNRAPRSTDEEYFRRLKSETIAAASRTLEFAAEKISRPIPEKPKPGNVIKQEPTRRIEGLPVSGPNKILRGEEVPKESWTKPLGEFWRSLWDPRVKEDD